MRVAIRVLAAAWVVLGAVAAAGAAEPRRVMVFGDSIAWGYVPRAEGPPSGRFPFARRWPGVMAAALGPGYEVVEESLNGRVTDFAPDPLPVPLAGAGLDGAAYLPAAIASQLPLDLVVVALGTNDTGYRRSPLEIGLGAMHLAAIVQDSAGGVVSTYPAPAVLLLAPAPLAEGVAKGPFGEFFTERALEASRSLGEVYAKLGAAAGVPVVRTADATPTDGVDGVHLEAGGHARLGKRLAETVRAIVPPP